MLNQRDLRSAFGAPDPAFIRAVRRTSLELTKKEEPVMKRKLRVSLLVAGLIVLLLAAVAFAAANHWGVLDFFTLYRKPIQPMASAKDMISSNLGSDENDKLRMTVREAVYDGAVVRVVVEVVPMEGSNLLLVDPWSSQELDSGDGAGDSWREKAKASGKTLYPLNYPELSQDPSAQNGFRPSGALYTPEGDSILFSLGGSVEGSWPESLSLKVSMAEPENLSIAFNLKKAGQALAAQLVPENAESAVCTILSATLHMTPLVGYVEVAYAPHEMPPARMSDDTIVYAPNGGYFHRTNGCSGAKNQLKMTYKEALDSGRLPCPMCLSRESKKPLLNFVLLDESGNIITGREDDWPKHFGPDETGEVKVVSLFQPFQSPPSAFYLRPYDADTHERYGAIRCTAENAQ